MMHKLYVRLVASFVLVIVLIAGFQCLALAITAREQLEKWRRGVFREYVEAFQDDLDDYVSYGLLSADRLETPLLAAAKDRVSGLILENPDGVGIVAFGSPDSRDIRSRALADSDWREHHIKLSVIRLSITQGLQMSDLVHSVDVSDITQERRTLTLPGKLKEKDVVGCIIVSVNEREVGAVDVLAFPPMEYQPLAGILGSFVGSMLIALCIACLLAFLLSLYLSRKRRCAIDGLLQALTRLTKGEHGIQLPKTNVEEFQQIVKQVEVLDAKLKKDEDARHQWLIAISHDLATPVTSLDLLLEGMRDGVIKADTDMLARACEETASLSTRIQRVVTYANLLSPDTQVHMTDIPVDTFLQDLQKEANEERILILKVTDTIHGDEKLLALATGELLKNALAQDKGRITLTIKNTEIIVENKGSLPQGQDLFDPWTKGDKSRGTEGNGLGLPIVRRIMQLHGGKASIMQNQEKIVADLVWDFA